MLSGKTKKRLIRIVLDILTLQLKLDQEYYLIKSINRAQLILQKLNISFLIPKLIEFSCQLTRAESAISAQLEYANFVGRIKNHLIIINSKIKSIYISSIVKDIQHSTRNCLGVL